MMLYQTRPTHVEAFCWTGGPDQSEDPVWICEAIADGRVYFVGNPAFMVVQIPGAALKVNAGDWVIRHGDGALGACKPEWFMSRYAPVLTPGDDMLAVLRASQLQFEFYADQHHAKGTPESIEKAVVNEQFAGRIAAVLGA